MTLEKESPPLMPAAGSGRIRAHVQLPESEPEPPPKDTQDAVQSTALRLRPGTVYGLFIRLGQCMHMALSCAIGMLMMMHMWLADWLAVCFCMCPSLFSLYMLPCLPWVFVSLFGCLNTAGMPHIEQADAACPWCASKLGNIALRSAGPAHQHPFAIDDPIQLPQSPSGFDPGDRFNVHKIRLAPLQTKLMPTGGQLPVGIASLPGSLVPLGEGRSAPGPVAEGLEVDASAASAVSAVSEAGMSEAGSSHAGDESQGGKWGMFKGGFWKR